MRDIALLAAIMSEAPKFNWRSLCFDKQRAFIEDPARMKALFTTRRGAKSFTDGIYLIKEAMENPNCNCLFLSLTRLSAKGIIWKDVLKVISDKCNLNITFNETELNARFPNGSVIYVAGVDTDENERKKLFGRKYKLVVIDEAALFDIDMHDLVYVALRPALTDLRGTLVMSGMASNITRGLFYDITNNKEPGWSLHQWTAYDNPHVAKQWAEEIEFIKTNQPKMIQTARFRQAYLNEWVVEDEAKVYKFTRQTNIAPILPPQHGKYSYLLGLDLAHSPDATAFVVGAYSVMDPVLYIVYASKHAKMDITDCALEVKRLNTKYDFDIKVVDGANKMAVEELNNRHNLGLIPADKTGKADFIKLMNDEFLLGKIKLLSGQCESLIEEYDTLIWVTDGGQVVEPRKEHPSIHNDLADSALYMWRYAYQYLFHVPEKLPVWGSQEQWEPTHIKKLEEEALKKLNPHSIDWEPDEGMFDFENDDGI